MHCPGEAGAWLNFETGKDVVQKFAAHRQFQLIGYKSNFVLQECTKERHIPAKRNKGAGGLIFLEPIRSTPKNTMPTPDRKTMLNIHIVGIELIKEGLGGIRCLSPSPIKISLYC